MVRPPVRLVQRSRSGQAEHVLASKRAWRRGEVVVGMVAVCPAGQVTVPASRSMVKSSLRKYPFGAAGRLSGRGQLDAVFGQVRRLSVLP